MSVFSLNILGYSLGNFQLLESNLMCLVAAMYRSNVLRARGPHNTLKHGIHLLSFKRIVIIARDNETRINYFIRRENIRPKDLPSILHVQQATILNDRQTAVSPTGNEYIQCHTSSPTVLRFFTHKSKLITGCIFPTDQCPLIISLEIEARCIAGNPN